MSVTQGWGCRLHRISRLRTLQFCLSCGQKDQVVYSPASGGSLQLQPRLCRFTSPALHVGMLIPLGFIFLGFTSNVREDKLRVPPACSGAEPTRIPASHKTMIRVDSVPELSLSLSLSLSLFLSIYIYIYIYIYICVCVCVYYG